MVSTIGENRGRAGSPGCSQAQHTGRAGWRLAGPHSGRVVGLGLNCPVTYNTPQANAIGRGAKSVREFLEKNYTDEAIETDDLTIKLVIKALLEVSVPLHLGKPVRTPMP